MKTDIQKFNTFKKRHNLCYEDIVKIVSEYAQTEQKYAKTYFSEKYHISEAVFYKARDFAVVCHLVDDNTCKYLKEKAAANYAINNGKNSSVGSNVHFFDLEQRRKKFLSSFSKEEVNDIAIKYVEGIKLEVISNTYQICEESVKKILKMGIEEDLISTSLVNEIKQKFKREGRNVQSVLQMEKVRTNNKLKKVEPLKKEIEILKFQISNYDSYFLRDENVPKKEFLEDRLNEVEKKCRMILDF